MIKIVTDSTALLSKEKQDEFNINIIPLNINVGEKSYKDGIDINGQTLIDQIENNPKDPFPITSQPSIGDFVDFYNNLTNDGSEILSIHMTDLLSGTVNSASQAAEIADGKVTVVNSHFIDQNLGHIVLEAAKIVQAGEDDVSKIVSAIKDMVNKSKLFIGASTLDNLVKGGRIGRAKGLVSKLMNLHVLFQLQETELVLQVKGRGKKTFTKWFASELEDIKNKDLSFIGISYTGSDEWPKAMQNELQEAFPNLEIPLMYTSAIVSTHTGNNAFAIMMCEK
ncbi:DegV family protein [Apilactobacillus sp. TMW 2.2459]|uniref:DegV family protein n=1 Tax=Apilactobacillus xinyiensis TaxID=2841032 RepID=UPI00200C9ACD|nr:DegV family protein [Apilactobacillus xinyiensis]MCL0312015.1 DegV family protein [Apilactobacillus xinyiensis]